MKENCAFCEVEIQLKKRHPKGQMPHGRHMITNEKQVCKFNADEMALLKGDGPKHWFSFKVIKELTEEEELQIMELEEKKKKEADEAFQKQKEEEEKKKQEEAERLKQLEQEAILNQQQNQEDQGGND